MMSTNLSSPLQRVISSSKSLSRLLFDLSLIANFSCSDSRARRCSAESASICRSRAKEFILDSRRHCTTPYYAVFGLDEYLEDAPNFT